MLMMKNLLRKFVSPSISVARGLSVGVKPNNLFNRTGIYPTHCLTPGSGVTRWKAVASGSIHHSILTKSYCSDAENSSDQSTVSSLTTPQEFVDALKRENIKRCFIVKSNGTLKTSHPILDLIAEELQSDSLYYDDHEAIFLTHGPRSGCLMAVFLWRTTRGQGAGGVDLRPMRNVSEMLQDGNRSSKHLGIKSALAGIWAGGGKGIIVAPPSGEYSAWDFKFRQRVFQDFGEFLTSLNGCMIAGAGVGSLVPDMDMIFTQTRYISNLSSNFGGTASSAWYTAKGVVKAMEAALDFLKLGSLAGKSVAIQGGGNVAEVVIDELLDQGARYIYVTECNTMRADDLRDKFAQKGKGRLQVARVSFTDTSIFKQHCDIFSPCARGKVLNRETIPLLDTKIVCGASNCQLDSEADQETLLERKITYVTDVVPNRMGVVSKLLEPYGRLENDVELEKHLSKDWEHSIYQTTLRVLQHAADNNISPEKSAFILGEQLSLENNPLYPNRTKEIIDNLVDSGWHEGNDFWRGQYNFTAGPDMI